jgi:transcriptional regulator with XRE-family HTH domain
MHKQLQNYLRAYRKRSGLSQDDVAFLLGTRSGTRLIRYESFERTPPLRTALGLAAIYRTPADEIFAGLQKRERLRSAARARILVSRLEKNGLDRRAGRKVMTLKAIASYLTAP